MCLLIKNEHIVGKSVVFTEWTTLERDEKLISGFHSALLQSITLISRPNAPNYTKLRSQNLRLYKF